MRSSYKGKGTRVLSHYMGQLDKSSYDAKELKHVGAVY
jgi:hypothetical protein